MPENEKGWNLCGCLDEFVTHRPGCQPDDRAKIVGLDLSEAAQRIAHEDGWQPHARMHPATAAKYEEQARD